MDFGIIEIVSLLTIILTGGFSIYGLINDYKDKEGNLTKHGRIAIYGIIISLTLSITGFGFKLKSDSDSKTKKLKQIEADVARQESTINKLDSVIMNIQRVSFPLTDLKLELIFAFDSTSKSITDFHNNVVTETLLSIDKESKYGFKNYQEIYAFWDTSERIGKPNRLLIFKSKKSSLFPNLDIPFLTMGLYDTSRDMDSISFQKEDGYSVIFTLPVYEQNNLIEEERLSYYTNSGKYEYSFVVPPDAEFSNSSIISHLDLKSVNVGVGLISIKDKTWRLEAIVFKNSLGLEHKFRITKSTDKTYPETTYVGTIN